VFLLIALALLLELLWIFFWAIGWMGPFPFLLAHFATMLLLGFGLSRIKVEGEKGRHLRGAIFYGYLLAAAFPLFGLLTGSLMILGVWRWAGRGARLYDEYEEYIYGLSQEIEPLPSAVLEAIRSEAHFDPYIDILETQRGDPRKPMVVEKLSREATPKSVKLLRTALSDPSVEVQQVAAGALGRIEDHLSGQIRLVQESIEQAGLVDDYIRLGSLCRQYANLGLLDQRMSKLYLVEASSAFEAAIEMNTQIEKAWIEYVDTLLDLGEMGRATQLLDLAEERGIESDEFLFDRLYIDFERGQIDRMRERLQGVDLSHFSEEKRRVLQLWLSK